SRRKILLRQRPGDGLYVGAENSRPLGGDDLWLLLGRLRNAGWSQRRKGGQRTRQSGPRRQPWLAVPQGTFRTPHDRGGHPCSTSAAAKKRPARPCQLGRGD